MKAYLIARGWTLERTHDVVTLLELCAAHDARWRDLMDEGAVLNEYIVSGRYPGDLAFEGIAGIRGGDATLRCGGCQQAVDSDRDSRVGAVGIRRGLRYGRHKLTVAVGRFGDGAEFVFRSTFRPIIIPK